MLEWLRAALLAAQSRSPGIRITLDVFPGTAGSRTQGVSFSLSFLSISLFFFSSARLCLAVFLFASMTFAPARTGVGFLAAERVVPRPPFQRAFTPCFPRSVLNSFGLSLGVGEPKTSVGSGSAASAKKCRQTLRSGKYARGFEKVPQAHFYSRN